MQDLTILDSYVKQKRLTKNSITVKGHTYHIYCYSKKQFHKCPWDDITIKNRGAVYDETGRQIGFPMSKVFNLGEHSSTSPSIVVEKLNSEYYEVLDKVNGFLGIVCYDIQNDIVLCSSKGSFSGQYAEKVKELVYANGIDKKIKHQKLNITFMFEVLAEFDKHLHYEQQIAKYGRDKKDCLVLLAAVDNTTQKGLDYNELLSYGFQFNVAVCDIHRVGLDSTAHLMQMLDHKDREGYVIHFPESGYRVKLKTNQYFRARYARFMRPEMILNKFVKSGFEVLYDKYDEEVYPILDALKIEFKAYIDANTCSKTIEENKGKDIKDIITDDSISYITKKIIVNPEFDFSKIRDVRKQFASSLSVLTVLDFEYNRLFGVDSKNK